MCGPRIWVAGWPAPSGINKTKAQFDVIQKDNKYSYTYNHVIRKLKKKCFLFLQSFCLLSIEKFGLEPEFLY